MRKRSLVLEDNDAVRICLLVLLQQGFLGHQLSHNVSDDMLKMVKAFIKFYGYWRSSRFIRLFHKTDDGEITRGFGLESKQPFYWPNVATLFVGDQLAPPLETLTPTKGESEADWWKTSLEYFEGKHVQQLLK
ncbi:hypothetical protein Tco_1293338 [Tanacetum coccineum]